MWKYLIYHRHKSFLNILEAVANDKPINIYIYIKGILYPFKKEYKTMFMSLTRLITKYQCLRMQCMLMSR